MPKASAGDPRARKRFRVEPKVICTVRTTTIRAVPVGESNNAFAVMHLLYCLAGSPIFATAESFVYGSRALRP
jgi:hypothetical protein